LRHWFSEKLGQAAAEYGLDRPFDGRSALPNALMAKWNDEWKSLICG